MPKMLDIDTKKIVKFKDKAYRNAYVLAVNTMNLSKQLRASRKKRGWTEEELARRIGVKTKVITKLEDHCYAQFSTELVESIASALDVAFKIEFVPFTEFMVAKSNELKESEVVKSFTEELTEDLHESGKCIEIVDKEDVRFHDRLAKTVFLVEATHYEQHSLWESYHNEISWQQDNPGLLITVGYLDKRPVNLSIFWNLLNGKSVLFWDVVSQVIDYAMVAQWFEKYCTPPSYDFGRAARCDASNFDHCVHAILRGMV